MSVRVSLSEDAESRAVDASLLLEIPRSCSGGEDEDGLSVTPSGLDDASRGCEWGRWCK